MIKKLNVFLYRFFLTPPGKSLLRLFAPFFLSVSLGRRGMPKHPFLVAITVDTEAGYVMKSQRRAWQYKVPRAYQGYTAGLEHWLHLAEQHKVPMTFLLSTHCFSAKGKTYDKIIGRLQHVVQRHELGLHLHQSSDLALQDELGFPVTKAGARFYDENQQYAMLKAARNLVRKHLGDAAYRKLKSFRWGTWSLNTASVQALMENGFTVDCSATPGIKGHQKDDMAYDWSRVQTHYPWNMSTKDYQNTTHRDALLQIPVATFDFFGKRRADPVLSELLLLAFDRYYERANRARKPFVFVINSHSTEATYENGWPTPVIDTMDDFIRHAKQKGAKFVTLQQARKMLR